MAGNLDDVAWSVVDAAPDGIVLTDEAGRVLLVNRQAEDLFGYDRGELLGRPVDQLLPERLRPAHEAHRKRYRAEPRTRPMGSGLPLLGRRKDGSEFPVEISLSPLTARGRLTVVAIVRDITDRLEAEERLRETEQELRLLEEHERIARDLHDIVIQQLFAAGMTLQGVWSRVEEPEVARRVAAVVDDLDRTIREIRTVIFGLQTVGAEASGLRGDVLRITSDARAALGFEPRLRFDGAVEQIPDEVAVELLATLRESLSNVARHADATEVEVDLVASIGGVRLRVVDNGRGVPDVPAPGGHGIPNLAERAARLGGRCEVRRRDEGGTEVEWWVPARRE